MGFWLSAIALVAFLLVFSKTLSGEDIRGLVRDHGITLSMAALVYGLAYLPMTLAWTKLASASGAQASKLALTRVLLVSQIGKYLPGNVAQFLGRAYFAREYGVPLASTGLAIALELAGILAACGLLVAMAIGLGMAGSQSHIAQPVTWVAVFIGIVALLGSAWIFRSKGMSIKALIAPLLWAICCYLAVLALLAIANLILLAEIGGNRTPEFAGQVAAAFLVSWLIGFATPGSPAGLGVREITFVALLSGSVPEKALLLTAAGFRLVTIAGDLVAWAIGVLLPATKNMADPPEPIPI